MFSDLTKAVDLFRNANNIGVVCHNLTGIDKAMSIVALSRLCKKEGKTLQVFKTGHLSRKIADVLKEEGLEVQTEPKSQNYIVSIDYSNANIEKVVCKRDESTSKLNFVITPGDELFSFDNVALIEGGSTFDALFSLGTIEPEEVFKEMFSSSKVISITKKESTVGDFKFLINGTRSYSEVMYEFLKGFSSNVSEDILNVLLKGVVGKYKLVSTENSNGWVLASNLIVYGADLTKVLQELYYSKDLNNFNLQRKVMEKAQIDSNARLAWSKVSKDEIKSCGVKKDGLDIEGRIVFNISKDFDLAFVIYELDEKNIRVVVESNDISKFNALDLTKVLDGVGSDSRAVFISKGDQGFEQKFFSAVKDIFKIQVTS